MGTRKKKLFRDFFTQGKRCTRDLTDRFLQVTSKINEGFVRETLLLMSALLENKQDQNGEKE